MKITKKAVFRFSWPAFVIAVITFTLYKCRDEISLVDGFLIYLSTLVLIFVPLQLIELEEEAKNEKRKKE